MHVNRKLLDAIASSEPINGLTHGFYRYPARFAPIFARAVIETFSRPGDVVLDPFTGSGTSLVEATVLGRKAVGVDLNGLAVFLARTKTTAFAPAEISAVRDWAQTVYGFMSVRTPTALDKSCEAINGIHDSVTWRFKKVIHLALDSLVYLDTERKRRLARCIILRTAQWALDCRSTLPSISQFKTQLIRTTKELLKGAAEFSEAMRACKRQGIAPRATCIHGSAASLNTHTIWKRLGPPKLVLTSPPYPGVHVLYHRWQIRGRKETSLPYWITGTVDGHGASFYTFEDRGNKQLARYFQKAEEAFTAVADVCDRNTIIVQLVAFSNVADQFTRYLRAMENAGLKEVTAWGTQIAAERLWRRVPHRKWYAEQKSAGSASEVVLFHRKA